MLSDLIGGQVQSAFDNLPASIEHIRAGRLRPLAVATATRSEVLPTVPTMADFVSGFEASATTGMGAVERRSHVTSALGHGLMWCSKRTSFDVVPLWMPIVPAVSCPP